MYRSAQCIRTTVSALPRRSSLMRALVYGALNPDIVHAVDVMPGPGDDIRSTSWFTTWGGKAANAAMALAGWGVDVRLLGLPVGTDALGESLLASLSYGHLDRSWIERTDEPTRHCIILVTPDGDRTIVCTGYAGAHWQQVPDAAWDGVDVALLDGFGGAAAGIVAEGAAQRHIPTVWLDAPDPVPAAAHLVVWSRHEHRTEEAQRLVTGGQSVILTAGSDPVTAWWGEDVFEVTPPAVEPVDATGAGDVFAAGCAYGIACEWAPAATVTFAAAAGAAAAARHRTSTPTLADIDALAHL